MHDIQHSELLSYSVRLGLNGETFISQCVHVGPIFYATHTEHTKHTELNDHDSNELYSNEMYSNELYSNVPRRPLPLPLVRGGVEEIR